MLRTLKLSGSHREVGLALGEATKDVVCSILSHFKESDLYERIRRFLLTAEGEQFYNTFEQTTRHWYPNYVKQVEGIADGAGVTFKDLFVLNLEPEFVAFFADCPGGSHDVKYLALYSGCTNVYVRNPRDQVFMVHTEDVARDAMDKGVMVDVTITEDGHMTEAYTAFVIPGILEGSKYGFNCHGMAYGNNNIYQEGINLNGVPRRFVGRRLIVSKDVEEMREVLTAKPGIATGYSYLILWRSQSGTVSSVNAEVVGLPDGPQTAFFTPSNFYFHLNMFQHLKAPCHPEASSIHRAALLAQYSYLPPPRDKPSLLQLVSNQNDHAFPLHRTAEHPDYLGTATTGMYDMAAMTLEVYTDLPNGSQPAATFNIPTHK